MTTRRGANSSKSSSKPPATTPEGRENQLISAAVNLAERQLSAGTASSQVITHYLKLASSRERLEQEKLRIDTDLGREKIEAIRSAARIEELYANALNAMRSYAGMDGLVEDYEE